MNCKRFNYLINDITNDVYRKCNDGKTFALMSPKSNENEVILTNFENCSPIKKQSADEMVNKQFHNFTEIWKHNDKSYENLNCFGIGDVKIELFYELPEHKRNTKLVYHHGRIFLATIKSDERVMLFDEDCEYKKMTSLRHCAPIKLINGNFV